MVCSAQHHQITIFKQQIRGVGRTFHRGEGEAFLRQFLYRATNQASFCQDPFVTHISVSCAESYSAELQNYSFLL